MIAVKVINEITLPALYYYYFFFANYILLIRIARLFLLIALLSFLEQLQSFKVR